jgi:beta-galactosidase
MISDTRKSSALVAAVLLVLSSSLPSACTGSGGSTAAQTSGEGAGTGGSLGMVAPDANGAAPTDAPVDGPGFLTGMHLPASHRLKINLGQTPWKFLQDTDPQGAETVAFDDSAWKDVGIPHTWNNVDTFLNQSSGGGDGSMKGGTNWYRKHFTLDAKYASRRILVEFEGAHLGAQVYINGTFLPGNSAVAVNARATHVVGFVPFIVDITNQVQLGGADNVLAVKVGKSGGFYEDPGFATVFRFGQNDGGLFRPVYMHITDNVHIPPNVYSVLNTWGTYVGTESVSDEEAVVKIQTNVQNQGGADQTATLTTAIVDADGAIVARAESIGLVPAGGQPILFEQTVTVRKPTPWYPNNSTFGKPYLYRVWHIVSLGATVVDTFETPLGVRTVTWDANFPIINGHPHYLWGASGRYDYPALGTAVPEEQQWRDVKLLAEAGGSLWRPGHSTSSPEFVDACDAFGVMVVQPSGEGEGAFSAAATTPDRETLKRELHRDMIVRDRNHPSILAWEANNGPMVTAFAQELQGLAGTWDSIGKRVQADRTPDPTNGTILGCTLVGCEMNNKRIYPNNPAWGSEYWGRHSARYAYDHEIEFAAEFLDSWRRSRAAKAFGIAQWYLAETPGEAGDFLEGPKAPDVRSFGSSMMDFNRIPKLLYYAYQAAWTPYETRPTVALAHHWNRSGAVRVNAFSNCPKVRLSINGTAVGDKVPNALTTSPAAIADLTQTATALPFQVFWDVTWTAGVLRADCLDANGELVSGAFDTKVTAGAPDHIVLTVEPPLVKPNGDSFAIRANGTDAAFILAKVVDAQGLWVPTATHPIAFAVSGPGTYRGGTDQMVTAGKPLTYHAPGDPELQAEGGLCKVAVNAQFQPGTVTVTASSSGLGSGTTSFAVVPVTP